MINPLVCVIFLIKEMFVMLEYHYCYPFVRKAKKIKTYF